VLRLRFLVIVTVLLTLPALALESVPAPEYHARRAALAAKLNGGAALIFAADAAALDFDPYRQDEDFYYLTGWNEPGAALVIEAPAANGGRYREILFLPTRNLRLEKYTGIKLDAATPNATQRANVDEVRPMTELPAELDRITVGDPTHNLSPTAARLFAALDQPHTTAVLDVLAASLGGHIPPASDVRPLITQLRMVKSPAELALLRKAGDASIATHRALFTAIQPGINERAISGLIDYKLKENGCERPSYASIVGSGPNSTTLHYSANSRTMQAGDVVVIDAAGEYSMYASDITRTYPVSGHFTPRQREIYDIVLGAQNAARQAFVAGKSYMGNTLQRDKDDPNNLDKVAFDYINTHGKDLHGEPLGKYFVHGLGHSVGIGVHDPFDYTKPMVPGSVFTIEPGIYIPEENLGVRIEDVVYVDANGKLIDFQESLPHTADDVEAAMKATTP
jgi:Xaa-Pro aminopeptidase